LIISGFAKSSRHETHSLHKSAWTGNISSSRPYSVLDDSAEISSTATGISRDSLVGWAVNMLISPSSILALSLRLNLKIELSPKDDLGPALELLVESISEDLEAYPESNEVIDRLLESLKRALCEEGERCEAPPDIYLVVSVQLE